MKTISLNGKDFSLKYTLRAFFVFETISGYPFQFGKMLDEFLLFYSFLLASNQELFKMEFEEFIELCENDLTLFEQFKEFILDEIKLRSQSAGNDVKKKKVEDGLNRRNREAWEQTRLLGFIIAQSNSTKTLKQTDILRFPWDEEEKKDTSVTDEEMQRLRAKAKEVESQLNTHKDV